MKRLLYFLAFVLVVVALPSCEKEGKFDEALLIGKWRSGTEYWVYERGHTGYTWDESDDVSEEDEQQPFTWELVGSELQITHFGGKIPKYYTVTELTATRLRYKDDYKSFSFTKAN